MQFREIPGLHETKNSLIEAVRKGHVAHAQLFAGPPGCANLALAIAFASFLNCQEPGEQDSCGKCGSCIKNQKYIHPDVHYIFPVSSTEKIKGKDVVSNNFLKEWRVFLEEDLYGDIEDWSIAFGGENKNLNISKAESRTIIQKLSLKAFEGDFKVIIIWMPEFMHPSAANGILKVLEEPSDKTVFILVANHADKLLGTILSRTQLVTVRAFSDVEVEQQLIKVGIEDQRASYIARLSGGNLKLALRLASESDDDKGASFKEWMRLCYSEDYAQLVEWADEFHKMTKVSQKGFLNYGLSLLRDTLMTHYGDSHLLKLIEEEKQFLKKFSKVITGDKIDPLSQLFSQALFHLERNGSAKMIFLDLSLKLAKQLKAKQIETQH